MSTHAVEVIRIHEIRKHPNADALGLVDCWGWTVAVRLDDFKVGDLAVYIPPDYVVPSAPQYEFLGEKRRIKVRKIRGTYSQGLLIPAPEGVSEGDDVMELLGITRYEPEIAYRTGGTAESGPSLPLMLPRYDVESWNRYKDVFDDPEELLVITEKIHGANARYVYWDNRMYCGSRSQWKQDSPGDIWWSALRATPDIEKLCRDKPGRMIYGEVFGQVQDLQYGAKPGQVFFAAFDILDSTQDAQWMNFGEAYDLASDIWVPLVADGLRRKDFSESLAEGATRWPGASNIREGVVIRPHRERWSPAIGRVQLKLVSNAYLERA